MTKLSSLVPKPLIDAVTRASRDDLVQLFCGFTDIELKRCVCTLAAANPRFAQFLQERLNTKQQPFGSPMNGMPMPPGDAGPGPPMDYGPGPGGPNDAHLPPHMSQHAMPRLMRPNSTSRSSSSQRGSPFHSSTGPVVPCPPGPMRRRSSSRHRQSPLHESASAPNLTTLSRSSQQGNPHGAHLPPPPLLSPGIEPSASMPSGGGTPLSLSSSAVAMANEECGPNGRSIFSPTGASPHHDMDHHGSHHSRPPHASHGHPNGPNGSISRPQSAPPPGGQGVGSGSGNMSSMYGASGGNTDGAGSVSSAGGNGGMSDGAPHSSSEVRQGDPSRQYGFHSMPMGMSNRYGPGGDVSSATKLEPPPGAGHGHGHGHGPGPGPGTPMDGSGYSPDRHGGRMMNDGGGCGGGGGGHSPDRYPHPRDQDQRNGAMHGYMGARGPNRGDHMRTTRSAARARMQQHMSHQDGGLGAGGGHNAMSPGVGSSSPPSSFGIDGGGNPSGPGGPVNVRGDFDGPSHLAKSEMMRRDSSDMASQALADTSAAQDLFPEPRRGSGDSGATVRGTVLEGDQASPTAAGGASSNHGGNSNNGSGARQQSSNTGGNSGGGGGSRRNGQYEKKFICEVCGRKYLTNGGLVRHRKSHGENGEARQHECPICSRRVTEKSTLQEHMRIHSGSKPFVCRECNKRFTHRSTLRNHRKLIHFEQNGSITIVFEEEADAAAAAAAVAANLKANREAAAAANSQQNSGQQQQRPSHHNQQQQQSEFMPPPAPRTPSAPSSYDDFSKAAAYDDDFPMRPSPMDMHQRSRSYTAPHGRIQQQSSQPRALYHNMNYGPPQPGSQNAYSHGNSNGHRDHDGGDSPYAPPASGNADDSHSHGGRRVRANSTMNIDHDIDSENVADAVVDVRDMRGGDGPVSGPAAGLRRRSVKRSRSNTSVTSFASTASQSQSTTGGVHTSPTQISPFSSSSMAASMAASINTLASEMGLDASAMDLPPLKRMNLGDAATNDEHSPLETTSPPTAASSTPAFSESAGTSSFLAMTSGSLGSSQPNSGSGSNSGSVGALSASSSSMSTVGPTDSASASLTLSSSSSPSSLSVLASASAAESDASMSESFLTSPTMTFSSMESNNSSSSSTSSSGNSSPMITAENTSSEKMSDEAPSSSASSEHTSPREAGEGADSAAESAKGTASPRLQDASGADGGDGNDSQNESA